MDFTKLETLWGKFKGLPKIYLYFYGVGVLIGLVYFGWSVFGHRPQAPSAGFVAAKPAVSAVKVPGPVVKVPVKVIPKKKVTQKYPEAQIADSEEWVDTAEVPEAPNGAVVLTKIDPGTGDVTNQVETKPAPLFAFERNNTLGAGYEIGTQGPRVPVYYRRDILRVKDVHLQAEIGGRIDVQNPATKSDPYFAVHIEGRF